MKIKKGIFAIAFLSLDCFGGFLDKEVAKLQSQGLDAKVVYRTSDERVAEQEYKAPPRPTNNPPALYDDVPNTRSVYRPSEVDPDFVNPNKNPLMVYKYRVVLDPNDASKDAELIEAADEMKKRQMNRWISEMPSDHQHGIDLLAQADRAEALRWLKDHLSKFTCCQRNHLRVFQTEKALGIGQQDTECDPNGYYGKPKAPWMGEPDKKQDNPISRGAGTVMRNGVSVVSVDAVAKGSQYAHCQRLEKDMTGTLKEPDDDIKKETIKQYNAQWEEFGCERYFKNPFN